MPLAPWFVNDLVFLLGCFLLVAVTTIMARVAGLVLFLFILGVFSQTGYLFVVSLLFGGNAETILPLLILTLKVATVSLASITVFSGLDPDRLSNGLMWYGCPEKLSFSISYAYRMLPMLMEEFQNVLLSYRLRGNAPDTDTIIGKNPVSDLPDQDDHPFFLSSYAEYGQAVPDNSGSPGNQRIPLRSRQ